MAEKKLADQVRDVIRAGHFSYKTVLGNVRRILQHILLYHKQHPLEMGEAEIAAFPT